MSATIRAELALRQRIEDRVFARAPAEVRAAPTFNADLIQADVIGACQVVNRYRCHGPILTFAIRAYDFMGSGSLSAMAVAVGLMGLVMAVLP